VFQNWQHELLIVSISMVVTVLLGLPLARRRTYRVEPKTDEPMSQVQSPTVDFRLPPAPARPKARPFTALGAFIGVYVATKLCDIAWDSVSAWVDAWLQTTGWFGAPRR
jgi:hypothetical protein